jgi:hypothetical protein
MPISFLDNLDALIHIKSINLELRALGVQMPMQTLPSQHRTLDICSLEAKGGKAVFVSRPDVLRDFGLAEDSFMLCPQYKRRDSSLMRMCMLPRGRSVCVGTSLVMEESAVLWPRPEMRFPIVRDSRVQLVACFGKLADSLSVGALGVT